MKHTCHALRCAVEVHPRIFMCTPHWRSLPAHLKAGVLAAYRPGQEVDKNPSAAYMKAAHAAILHHAEREHPEAAARLKEFYERVDSYNAKRDAA